MQQTDPTKEIGWFRTPIAAAMLSGVLSAAAGILLSRTFMKRPTASEIQSLLVLNITSMFASMTLDLSGPAICRRSGKLFLRAALYVIPIFVIQLIMTVLPTMFIGYVLAPSQLLYRALGLLSQIVSLCLISYALSRLYELRPCPPRVFLVALLTASAVFAFWRCVEVSRRISGDSAEVQDQIKAVTIMLRLFAGMATTVFPTMAIEKALRAREAAIAKVPAEQPPLESPPANSDNYAPQQMTTDN